ncbi:NADPH-dependent ferric siderophore reductase [Paracoccus pantotrophus]|uniref:NADPH-dependent ferric siderophore reductase n=2 Tax=Paracoccus TaxID=265 RepID=A0A1I5JMG5_PARPN|nr:siderophore-interacting protein [Paracoccus pantotrophus]MDF3853485.1 siderophore-interacting protein [Paracoccus pantotrophus]QFG37997.1 siderophore-interacting protein [Paracoccus pantotrophus]QLH15553.1 siderophore-interacting protein [Paracoccus pantotrophus]RDD93598.1 siderophore-interacting protein [Paracoccus pantotrophus]RKS51515.1 NADPH-dependent ferric siderophore reductase [Paracoccus pantotrophus]
MRITPLPEFQSEALLPGQDFAPIEQLIRDEAQGHGLELHSGHGRSIWCQVEMGEFGAKRRGDGVLVFARAHRAEWLEAMQQAIFRPLAQHLPTAAAALRWPSAEDAGKPPGHFSLAHVAEVAPLCRDFLRVRLAAPDLHRLATEDSLHFRLVLPQPGDEAPEWPRLGAHGQILWPRGDKALHRPVYTVRRIDADAGWLDLDIFDHPGGRAAHWARMVRADRQVGLLGPSGGGVPQAAQLMLAGDETAWPAIARILESRAGTARGEVFLLGARPDYPLPRPAGFRMRHLPGGTAALCALLRAAPPRPDSYLWAAAEKSGIAALRALLLETLGHDRVLSHLAAYWSA